MKLAAAPIVGDRRLVAVFFLLLVANLLIGNATTVVWDQDEAAYAGFARNMACAGHWLVPEFPYAQPHRKVPLAFWLMAASYKVLGVSEFALRLPSVLAILGTTACLWYGGRFLLGTGTAQLAALLFGSALCVLNLGKLALTDPILLFFQTLAALALLSGAVRPSWQATVGLWLAVAAGLLTKGPPILILVGGMFLFLLLFYPRRRNLVHLHPWFGLPLACLPLAIWINLVWQQDPRYVLFLGYWYVLRRVGGTVFGQSGPPGTYFLLLFVGLLPWSAYLLGALADTWKRLRRRRLVAILVSSWLFGGWIIWELLPSKLPTYTLGAYPALALLLARQVRASLAGEISWHTDRLVRVGAYIVLGLSVAIAAGALSVALWLGTGWLRELAVLPGTALVLAALYALRFQRRKQPRAAAETLLIGFLVGNFLAWLVIVPSIEPRRAVSLRVAQALAQHCQPGTMVVMARDSSAPSLPFYIEQAGLRFWDIDEPEEKHQVLKLDLSGLWRLRFDDLVRQVRAQNPQKIPAEEQQRIRLERIATLWASGQPLAFILDDAQYAAVQDRLAGAAVMRVDGWLSDRGAAVRYTLVITPRLRRFLIPGIPA
jgi:4-amino-4-deoxy-L-arabinose transferase-like glycosyltransferase